MVVSPGTRPAWPALAREEEQKEVTFGPRPVCSTPAGLSAFRGTRQGRVP